MKFTSTILIALALSFTSVTASPTPTVNNSKNDGGEIDVAPYAPGNPMPDHVHASSSDKNSPIIDIAPEHPGDGVQGERVNKPDARGLIGVGSGTPGNPTPNAVHAGNQDDLLDVKLGPGTPGNANTNKGDVKGGNEKMVGFGPGTPGNATPNSVGLIDGHVKVEPATGGNPTPNHATAKQRRQDDGSSTDDSDDSDDASDGTDSEQPDSIGLDKRAKPARQPRPATKPKPHANKAKPTPHAEPKGDDMSSESSPGKSDAGSNASKDVAAAMNQIKGSSRRRGLDNLAQGDVCLQIGAINNPACSSPAPASSPLSSGSAPVDDSSFGGLGNILAIKPNSETDGDHYLLGAILGDGSDAPVIEVLPDGSGGQDDSTFGGPLGFAPALPSSTGTPDDSTFGGPLGFAPALVSSSSSASPTAPASSSVTSAFTASSDAATSSDAPSPAEPSSSAGPTPTASSASAESATASSSDAPAPSSSPSPSDTPNDQSTSQATVQDVASPTQSSTSSATPSASGLDFSVSVALPTGPASAAPSAVPTGAANLVPATGNIGSLPTGTVACPSSLGLIHATTGAMLGQLVTLCIDASLLDAAPSGTARCTDPDHLIASHADNQNPSLLSRILGSRSRFTGLAARARSVRRNGDLVSLCLEAGAL